MKRGLTVASSVAALVAVACSPEQQPPAHPGVAAAPAVCPVASAGARPSTTSTGSAESATLEPLPSMLDAIPDAIFQQMTNVHRAIGSPGLTWKQRSVKVAFTGGSDPIYELIERTASEWTAQGGELTFSFREQNGHFRSWHANDVLPLDIRIAFVSQGDRRGYWSAVGILANSVAAKEPTMNLDGFTQKLAPYVNSQDATAWKESYEHTVILHEFGHALGLHHEHFQAQCQTDLNLVKAIAALMLPPNCWTHQQAQFNMDAQYYFDQLAANSAHADTHTAGTPAADSWSVMLYSFPSDFYTSGAASPCKPAGPRGYATELSGQDRQFFIDHYAHL